MIAREGARVRLEGFVPVEEAEGLLALLLEVPGGEVDLSACTGLHTAVLQVLLAARAPVAAPPEEPFLRNHVLPLLLAPAREKGTP